MFATSPGDDDGGPRERRSRARRVMLWVAGLLVAALGATIVGVLTGLPGQLLDLDAAKDQLRPGPDLRTRVDVVHLDDQGYSMAFADDYTPTQNQDQLTRAIFEDPEALSRHLRRSGGVDVERLTLRVLLEGRSNQEIHVVDIRPVDLRRTAPLEGTLFFVPPQEGAASIVLLLNMDERVPVATGVDRVDEWGPVPGGPFFESNSIRLADREQDILVIRVSATREAVQFRLQADYLLGDDLKSTVIDDDGKPFALTPLNCVRRGIASYRRGYEFGAPKPRPEKWVLASAEVRKNPSVGQGSRSPGLDCLS
jgi:hypothetical protein